MLQRAAGFDTNAVLRGGYVIRDEGGAQATLIATGAEVSLALDAAFVLQKSGTRIRVVSMPCVELFLQQPPAWQKAALGDAPIFALEMGKPELWCRFTGRIDRCIGQETFGVSAPAKKIAEHFGFTAEAVAQRIRAAI
jgi:transketolase